jgi:DNA-binding GntR family transcriptional regulator
MNKNSSINRSLRFKAYEDIKNSIIYLNFKPGEKIYESEIVNRLKISRTPVREALLMLENEKLVECNASIGFIVRKLSAKEVAEYFSIRKTLEGFAVPLIIQRITDSEISELKGNIEQAEKCLKENNIHNIIRYETEFHEILYKSTNSEVFFQTVSGLVDKFQWLRAMGLSAPGGSRLSLDDHKKMFQTLRKRDCKELKRLLYLHIQHAEEKYTLMQRFL